MKKVSCGFMVCVISFMLAFVPVVAQDANTEGEQGQSTQSFTGQIVTLSEDSKAYSQQDENSEVVHSFLKGETVFVVETTDDWYQIYYQGENLYIPINSITYEDVIEANKQAEEQAQIVTEELEEAEKAEEISLESLERRRISQRNALIWKIIIAGLVVAIIIVSVVIAISNVKNDKGDK